MNDLVNFVIFYSLWFGFSWTICVMIPTIIIQNYDKIIKAMEKHEKR